MQVIQDKASWLFFTLKIHCPQLKRIYIAGEVITFQTVMMKINPAILILFALSLTGAVIWLPAAAAAPSADLWPRWQAHSSDSTQVVDHTSWDMLLKKYLATGHPSGINRFRYADVTGADRQALDTYLQQLQITEVSTLNQQEQKAYWVNLYNSLTVKVILEHFPVKSIMDIDISPGLFSNGPWDAKLIHIENETISLNDIEHRILRPIFNDNRLHYALNCASIGCPNLQPVAFTAANTEELLEKGAREYINSPRGVRMKKDKLQVSSIYKWFQSDFGGSEKGVILHLQKYSEDSLGDVLKTYKKGLRFDYDWELNQP